MKKKKQSMTDEHALAVVFHMELCIVRYVRVILQTMIDEWELSLDVPHKLQFVLIDIDWLFYPHLVKKSLLLELDEFMSCKTKYKKDFYSFVTGVPLLAKHISMLQVLDILFASLFRIQIVLQKKCFRESQLFQNLDHKIDKHEILAWLLFASCTKDIPLPFGAFHVPLDLIVEITREWMKRDWKHGFLTMLKDAIEKKMEGILMTTERVKMNANDLKTITQQAKLEKKRKKEQKQLRQYECCKQQMHEAALKGKTEITSSTRLKVCYLKLLQADGFHVKPGFVADGTWIISWKD